MTDAIENAPAAHDETQSNDRYLGKFDTPEAMAESYKELEKAYSSKESYEKKYQDLEQKYQVPDEYTATGTLLNADDSALRGLAEEAKGYGMSQEQFERWASNKLEVDSSNKKESVSIDSDMKSYLLDREGLSESMISGMSKEDVARYSERRQSSLNSDTNIINSGHSPAINRDYVNKLYQEFKNVERLGGTQKSEAFTKWKNASETIGK